MRLRAFLLIVFLKCCSIMSRLAVCLLITQILLHIPVLFQSRLHLFQKIFRLMSLLLTCYNILEAPLCPLKYPQIFGGGATPHFLYFNASIISSSKSTQYRRKNTMTQLKKTACSFESRLFSIPAHFPCAAAIREPQHRKPPAVRRQTAAEAQRKLLPWHAGQAERS